MPKDPRVVGKGDNLLSVLVNEVVWRLEEKNEAPV